jgi:hypothetical protein
MKTSSEDLLACRSARSLARLVRGPLSFERAGRSSRVVKMDQIYGKRGWRPKAEPAEGRS